MNGAGRRFFFCGAITLLGAMPWTGCGSSYPKEKLHASIQELFKEELDVDCKSKLAGKTLYVSFPIQGLVSENFELSENVTTKLENAMLSISRIALSTNADIDYTVLDAMDETWGIRTLLIRRMQDLKSLVYWKISKTDFDERLVMEIKRDQVRMAGEKEGPDAEEEWRDIQLGEYMGRWVASRINMGMRSNPFLGALLGIEKVTPQVDLEGKTLVLEVDHFDGGRSPETSVSLNLFKNTVQEQMAAVEKKYSLTDWVDRAVLKDNRNAVILTISREEWKGFSREKLKQQK